ncbi:unnamed protein product [Orchesella dallaii]|uniref:Guanylate-binding protein N-terminal domain-containing protein n=1 Tax=Orchesella dallaii TaxID=48710 RepID=A0ABP1RT92_9HEXA
MPHSDNSTDSGVERRPKDDSSDSDTSSSSETDDDTSPNSNHNGRKRNSSLRKSRKSGGNKRKGSKTVDSDDSEDDDLILNEKPLQLPLGDLPVCPIILIGPPNQGKSFLANFILRKLESLEDDYTDWIGLSTKQKPLTGFPWRTVDKRKTLQEDGLYIWHRPFIIETENGKVGVLLIECNGFQDDLLNSQKMQTSIFGLSFLMSSVLVYTANSMSFKNKKDFTNDLFTPWMKYSKFGAKICKEEDEKTPFQNISFLIRDWDDSGKYCFGARDGKKFLMEHLNGIIDEGVKKYTERALKSYFSSQDYFLLPPASEVFSEEDFDGSLERIPTDFSSKLSKYVDNLISDKTLPIKKIGNGAMGGYEFKMFLSSYVDLFNGYIKDQEKIGGSTLYKTTFRIFNDSIVSKSVSKYQAQFEREQRGVPYLVEDLHQVAHDNAVEKAENTFRRSPMKAKDKPTFRKRLTEEMKEAFSRIQSENEKKRNNFISECLLKACQQFEEGLQKNIKFPDENTFHDETKIREIGNQLEKHVTQKFLSNFDGETKENLTQLEVTTAEKLAPILQFFLDKNKQNRRHAEGIMKNVIDLLLRRYKKDMTEFITDEAPVPTPTLQVAHKIFKKIILRKYGKRDLPGTQPFQLPYSNELSELMEDTFMAFANGEQSKIEIKEEQGNLLLNKFLQQYQQELHEVLSSDDKMSEEDCRHFHRETSTRILKDFQQQNPFQAGNILGEKLNKNLMDEMETEFDAVLRKEIQMKRKIAETCENAKSVSLQQYIEDLETAKFEMGFIENDELISMHERLYRRVLAHYDEHTECYKEDATVSEQKKELESKLQEEFETFKATNARSQQGSESEAKLLLKDFKKMYVETMSIDNLKTGDELKNEHEKKKTEMSNTFFEMLGRKSKSFKEKYVSNLVATIDRKFQDLKLQFEMKVATEEIEFQKVIQRSRDYYHEQMKKECENSQHITSTILEALHEKISKDAIAHGSQGYQMTEDNRAQLKESLGESYVKYKMEYTMYSGGEGDELAVGIDLGTTYCCVAVLQNKEVKIVANQDGEPTTPSYIAFNLDDDDNADTVIGQTAKDDAFRNPENTVFDAKRIIGRRMDDEKLQSDIKFWPFKVVQHDGSPKVEIRGTPYPPEQISAILLRKLKEQVEARLGQPVKKAVITVPAYFDDGQRAATKDAGEVAGFEVLTILNEPTAAAIAYKVKQFNEGARKVVVFDLGGGTFDVAVLQTGCDTIEVLSVGGDTHLGGEDFDKNLMEYCVKEFRKETGLDLLADKDSTDRVKRDEAKRNLRRLQTYCEKAKRALTFARQTKISVDNFASGFDLHVTVTRQKFEELNMNLFEKTIGAVDDTLKSAKVPKDQVDDIVLIGGSTKIPKVQEMLSKHFNNRALSRSVNADEAVAYGAAVQAALLNGSEGKRLFNFKSIRDVTPMSLGIKMSNKGIHDIFSVIIPKNTKIPHSFTKTYFTGYDDQEVVRIEVYQGENTVASKNKLLGEFTLEDIPPGKAGEQEIDVSMEVDYMGILHVKGVCKSTNSSKEITVTVKEEKGRLTEAQKKKLKAKIAKPVSRPRNKRPS